MEPIDQTAQPKKLFVTSFVSIIIVIFVLMIVALFVINLAVNQKNSTQNTTSTQVISPALTHGTATMVLVGPTQVRQNDPITVAVVADSQALPVNGFDIVLNYDPNLMKFLGFTNEVPDFQVFQVSKDNPNRITLTGAKRLNTSDARFARKTLVKVNFQPILAGSASFSLDFTPGSREDTNLVGTGNSDMLGTVKGFSVTVQ